MSGPALPPPPSPRDAPTQSAAGGGLLAGWWRGFRGLPVWAQVLLWLVAWPLLAGLFFARWSRLGPAGVPVGVTVLLFGGLLWLGLLAAPEEASEVALDQAQAAPAPAPTPTPSPTPTPTPSPTPTPTPTPSATPTPTPTPAPTEVVAAPSGELEVHFIDVGQGDATLLRAPDATVLVDTGRHDRSDVVAYLSSVGIAAIDVIAVTHPHADHLGQFDRILETFTVSEVWWSGATHTTQNFQRAVAALEASAAAYDEPRAGDATSVGRLHFDFINPSAEANFNDLHDSSLAFRVTYGAVSLLFTGDAEARTEQRMTTRHADLLAADVYQVGHHGSRTSTIPGFLAAVNPAVAVYSAGAGNHYDHPHAEVLARLVDAGVELYGTDVHGTVIVTTDGADLAVRPSRDAPPTADAPAPPAPDPPPELEPEPDTEQAPAQPEEACNPGQVNINTAGFETLQEIIHIGPDRAQQIINLRPFSSVDALNRVSGIAEARLRDIKHQGLACA